VGYRQPGQFTKAFKRAHKQTPSQFRTARRRSSPER
jgi:AraC-like DNA-binding protein